MPKRVYKLTDEDKEIFALARKNFNYFTDYYLRTPLSGTYLRPDEKGDPRLQERYAVVREIWEREQRPSTIVMVVKSLTFSPQWREKVLTDEEIVWEVQPSDDPDRPVFFHNHGFRALPWQLKFHHAEQTEITIIGGFGSGKTLLMAVSLLTMAAMLPGFRGFVMAPKNTQAAEVLMKVNEWTAGSVYEERFIYKVLNRPPKIVVANDAVGKSNVIEFYAIEKDWGKVRTLQGDVAYIDQAEQLPDLDGVVRDVGTRLRGTYAGTGRRSVGRLAMFANAGDSPELWDRFDMQEQDPEIYLSMIVSSLDNPHLTQREIDAFKRRVGGTQQAIEQWIHARRPVGQGIEFTTAMLRRCHDESLDTTIQQAVEQGREGFHYEKAPRVGIYWWQMPADPSRIYLVAGDPGQSNPPNRNSPVILVWDITDFPSQPAVLRVFRWIWGNGTYTPFTSAFASMVEEYRAFGRNTFDSTGPQTGLDEFVFSKLGLLTDRMSLSGSQKQHHIMALKNLFSAGMLRIPYIGSMWYQLTHYRLPDAKLRQDIVSAMVVSAGWLFNQLPELSRVDDDFEEAVIYNRYRRAGGPRYTRRRT